MAVQFAVAHADMVRGVGVIAGGPYRCAADGMATALGTCMQGIPDPSRAVAETEAALLAGRIDHPKFMQHQRVWLFSGYNDGVVKRPVMDSLHEYYQHYVPDHQIYYQTTLGSGHAMITEQQGNACQLTGEDFLNDCDYDAAGLMLQHIYGRLHPPDSSHPTGRLTAFDQNRFIGDNSQDSGLARLGYLYVPESCSAGARCRIHVVFHGCRQFAERVGDAFYAHAGYNRWADDNRIVLLYPQTRATNLGPFNPKGCWDWWGYTGSGFAYRDGVQISAIRRMLATLSSGSGHEEPEGSSSPALLLTDATADSVALAWTSVTDATGYRIYRATASQDRWSLVTPLPADRVSHVDKGLSSHQTYHYRLAAINEEEEEVLSAIQSLQTRNPPPYCDPYFSDNVTHVTSGRAIVWLGLTFAKGSWDYMGLWNLLTETALYREDDEFRVGVCP